MCLLCLYCQIKMNGELSFICHWSCVNLGVTTRVPRVTLLAGRQEVIDSHVPYNSSLSCHVVYVM